MKKALLALMLALAVAGTAQAAEIITFTGTNGSNLAASAKFEWPVSGNLVVTLTNTSTFDVDDPPDVLTALFFDLSAGVTLTPVSAYLGSGSTWFFDTTAPNPGTTGGNVGGEWAYAPSLVGAPRGATNGIGSAGFGLFGSFNFNGPELYPPTAVNGLDYGIVSAGDNPGTGNAKVTGEVPLIKNSVVFTLGYTGTINYIGNVSFQYGTALDEPNFGQAFGNEFGSTVPDGGTTAALLGLSMLGLGFLRRLKKS
jgi:hypothetical protein